MPLVETFRMLSWYQRSLRSVLKDVSRPPLSLHSLSASSLLHAISLAMSLPPHVFDLLRPLHTPETTFTRSRDLISPSTSDQRFLYKEAPGPATQLVGEAESLLRMNDACKEVAPALLGSGELEDGTRWMLSEWHGAYGTFDSACVPDTLLCRPRVDPGIRTDAPRRVRRPDAPHTRSPRPALWLPRHDVLRRHRAGQHGGGELGCVLWQAADRGPRQADRRPRVEQARRRGSAEVRPSFSTFLSCADSPQLPAGSSRASSGSSTCGRRSSTATCGPATRASPATGVRPSRLTRRRTTATRRRTLASCACLAASPARSSGATTSSCPRASPSPSTSSACSCTSATTTSTTR